MAPSYSAADRVMEATRAPRAAIAGVVAREPRPAVSRIASTPSGAILQYLCDEFVAVAHRRRSQ